MRNEIEASSAVIEAACPLLVPVRADRLWVYPTSAFCRRPSQRVRVPGNATLADVCTTPRYLDCAGYRASASGPDAPDLQGGRT
jgi:hypothetical protein